MVESIEGYRLSLQQERVWLLGGGSPRPWRSAWGGRVVGEVDLGRLRAAVLRVVERNEVLRTLYRYLPGMRVPVLVITEAGAVEWVEAGEVAGFEQAFEEELQAGCELETGPILRVRVASLAGGEWGLIVSAPTLAVDRKALGLLVGEMVRTYAAGSDELEVGNGVLSYVQFAEWQREVLEEPEVSGTVARLHEEFAAAALEVPFGFEMRAGREEGFVPRRGRVNASVAALDRARRWAQAEGVGMATVLLAAWSALVHRATEREELWISEVLEGREYEVLEQAVGLFEKSVPVGVAIESAASLADLVAAVERRRREREEWVENFIWGAEGPRMAERPRYASAAFEHRHAGPQSAPDGLSVREQRESCCVDRFKLKLVTWERTGEIGLELLFDGRLFDARDIERLARQFVALLEGAVAEPRRSVAHLALLTATERAEVLLRSMEGEAIPAVGPCVHELFEAEAEAGPARAAVRCHDVELSYGELNRRANQLAHRLVGLGVGPETAVGILLERSVKVLVSMMAVLKAGGAYVVLDPSQPGRRLEAMVEECGASVVVTEELLSRGLAGAPRSVSLDRLATALAASPDGSLGRRARRENLAYIVFTSGSTGRPKGVAVEHRHLASYLQAVRTRLGLPHGASYASVSTFAADLGNTSIFPALCGGGRLHVVPQETAGDPAALARCFDEHPVDCLKIVPSHLEALLNADDPRRVLPCAWLVMGGEAQSWQLAERVRRYRPELRIFNHYGPSETTVGVLAFSVPQSSPDPRLETVPLGRPLPRVRAYVVDGAMEPLPPWYPGELWIGGASVSRGYLGRPALTAQRFIPDPYAGEPGARVYRSGDVVRMSPEGLIEFLGRADSQIKYHGFRLELGEVRAALNRHPQVRDSLVRVEKELAGQAVLIAYYVARQELDRGELRGFLEDLVLAETIPSFFVHLKRIPLTVNGKVNLDALPKLAEIRSQTAREIQPARTPTEELLVEIWREVLHVDRIGAKDNFFELGGHSLIATQLVSRARQVFETEVPLRSLFQQPTLEGFAACIDACIKGGSKCSVPALVRVPRGEGLALSFAQERLWLMHQLAPGSGAYNISLPVRLSGDLSVRLLAGAIGALVDRHEALRTSFRQVDGEPFQVIADALRCRLRLVDLGCIETGDRERLGRAIATQEARKPFDLAALPLFRVTLVRLGGEAHLGLFTLHHIIADGWSLGIIVREVGELYRAGMRGEPASLGDNPIQYADFAIWQRQWLAGETLREYLSYWSAQLAGAPEEPILTGSASAAAVTFDGEQVHVDVAPGVVAELRRLGQGESATLFMTLLAAFDVVLFQVSGMDDIVVGTDVANRNRLEAEGLVGFLVNNLVLRVKLGGDPTFRELLRRVRRATLEAFAYQDVPFEVLVKELRPKKRLSETPFFQVLFVLQNAPTPVLELPGLRLSGVDVGPSMSKFDLGVFVRESENGLRTTWSYKRTVLGQAGVAELAEKFVRVLERVSLEPEERLSALRAMGDLEPSASGSASPETEGRTMSSLRSIRRKAVDLTVTPAVAKGYLTEGQRLPLVVQPTTAGVDLADWLGTNRQTVDQDLLVHGAILLRGFGITQVDAFEAVATAVCGELYGDYGDLPHEGQSRDIYQSTPYPADREILFHNESSHMHCWPLKQLFCCLKAAAVGGETPIVDCRRVYQLLDPQVRREFCRRGLRYVRNFTEGLDVSWQQFFSTDDRSVAEDFCRRMGIGLEWTERGARIWQCAPAVARHPRTGETSFFNQAQLHHLFFLEAAVRESMLAMFKQEELPRNVYYGDGGEIEDEVMKRIGDLYHEQASSFPWLEGDVLLLDNMLVAHSRRPFEGERKILVALGEVFYKQDLQDVVA